MLQLQLPLRLLLPLLQRRALRLRLRSRRLYLPNSRLRRSREMGLRCMKLQNPDLKEK